ncbi:conjugative transfer signal peptidase TraF (plasmid) [Pasteurella multocida]|uniref:conjugative transfer signal peptidase TraF n=1 Tax=Pasteurella multocida TaxID=747 RepID=UPI002ED0EC06|nr:conjugative transfer signal peptidase TraF [Pasteurella multocida]
MMKKLIWISKWFIFSLVTLFFIMLVSYFIGVRINTTPSIPIGIYKVTDKRPTKGDIVSFCPPNTSLFQEVKSRGWVNKGFCNGELGTMMKVLVAEAGDIISIDSSGVFINGKRYPYSKQVPNLNLPVMELHNHSLIDGEILTMTDNNPLSFDGRYYGILNKSVIESVLEPILTW